MWWKKHYHNTKIQVHVSWARETILIITVLSWVICFFDLEGGKTLTHRLVKKLYRPMKDEFLSFYIPMLFCWFVKDENPSWPASWILIGPYRSDLIWQDQMGRVLNGRQAATILCMICINIRLIFLWKFWANQNVLFLLLIFFYYFT